MQSTKPILPKSIAEERGIKRYFTNKVCRNGHLEDRMVVSKVCLGCQREANAEHYKKTLKRRRQTELKERIRQQGKAYRERNADKIRRRDRELYAKNALKERAAAARYRRNNAAIFHASQVRLRLKRARRVPSWLTLGQHKEVENLYKEARRLTKETGVQHHVDHIVPLNGKNVSGLHVPDNLRIVTAKDNLKKGNSFDPFADNDHNKKFDWHLFTSLQEL